MESPQCLPLGTAQGKDPRLSLYPRPLRGDVQHETTPLQSGSETEALGEGYPEMRCGGVSNEHTCLDKFEEAVSLPRWVASKSHIWREGPLDFSLPKRFRLIREKGRLGAEPTGSKQ